MAFHTASFAAFFALFLALYGLVLTRPRHKLALLVLGGLVFYASSGVRFVPLLLLSLAISYAGGRAISAAGRDRARRRRRMLLACGASLLLLAIFKYTAFLAESANGLLALAGVRDALPVPRIALPIGISFYTFQSLSYLVDVHRRARPAEDDLLRFAAYVTFFPPLVAGPIVRARALLPQLEKLAPPDWTGVRRGFLLFGVGLMKKTVADLVAPMADTLFVATDAPSALAAWTGLLAYAAQMFGDFSGWSDMAIGCAAVLGFALPRNFDLPYLAGSPVEVWTRWHMTLSAWLRDYVFWPLGPRHLYRNLFVTWGLCGLWHGASWLFVTWGLYWGALIAATHALDARFGERQLPRVVSLARIPFTFYLWLVGLSIFGAHSLTTAGRIVAGTFGLAPGAAPSVVDGAALVSLGGCILALVVPHAVDGLVLRRSAFAERALVLWPLTLACLAFAIAFGEPGQQFLYWRF